LHVQRSWPVISEPGERVGRHHHPNAHLSAIYYFNGDGTEEFGVYETGPAPARDQQVSR